MLACSRRRGDRPREVEARARARAAAHVDRPRSPRSATSSSTRTASCSRPPSSPASEPACCGVFPCWRAYAEFRVGGSGRSRCRCGGAPWTAVAALALALSVEGGDPRRRRPRRRQHRHVPRSSAPRRAVRAPGSSPPCSPRSPVVARTSALTLSVAATLKEVVTIGVAEEVFHDHLTKLNVFGAGLCLLGARALDGQAALDAQDAALGGVRRRRRPRTTTPATATCSRSASWAAATRWVRQD